MIFSTTTRYALIALAALPEDGSYRQAGVLAHDLDLPAQYLPKILRSLVRHGLLESVTGPEGGFRLARPAHHITLGEVARLMGEKDCPSGCVLGLPDPGSHAHPCALYDAWQAIVNATVRDLHLLNRPVACPRLGRPRLGRPHQGRPRHNRPAS